MDNQRSKYDPRKDPAIKELRITMVFAIFVIIWSITAATAFLSLLPQLNGPHKSIPPPHLVRSPSLC